MYIYENISHVYACACALNGICLYFQVSPTPSSESLKSQQSLEEFRTHSRTLSLSLDPEAVNVDPTAPFMPRPFCIYAGHTADVLDLSWSKVSFFL